MNIADRFKDEGFLVSPDVLNNFKGDVDQFIHFIKTNQPDIDVIDSSVLKAFDSFLRGGFASKVKVTKNYEQSNEARDISHWLGYYNKRYDFLSNLISQHVNLRPVMSISRASKIINRNDFSVIGFVTDVRKTANDNFVIELEDPTGTISLLVSKSSTSYSLVENLVLDEVIGVNLRKNGRWFFVDDIIFPEVPIRPVKNCNDDGCAVFISDTHVGSINFLPEEFQRFFDWLNGKRGSPEERVLASKVKYLFITGDLVDGVGIYPTQEDELEIKDIYKQYEKVAEYLRQVPENVKIIISPGNHDAVRLALPQPPLTNKFATALRKVNALFVSNPATVNIHSGNGFSGYDVLVYHGNSFDHFVGNVPLLRKTGYEKPEAIMEFLLRKRHLSPTHGGTLVAPTTANDFLLIDKVPDVFITGHVHQSGVGTYKGITLLNSSCFQGQSSFMKRLGIVPDPGKIPVMSLRNKKVHVMNFMK